MAPRQHSQLPDRNRPPRPRVATSQLLWPSASDSKAKVHLRLAPIADISLRRGKPPLWAKRPTYAVQQKKLYSITSSAVASNVDGTVKPSALAVLRLIAKSNLVGCGIGKSAGLAPLRMRPV